VLTDRQIEKVKAGSKRQTHWDSGGVPGLGLIVQTSGKKSFALWYRSPRERGADGKARAKKLTLGRYPRLTLKDARKLANEALRAVEHGTDPGAEKKAAGDASQLFPTVAQQFIETYSKPRNKAWREQARILGLRYNGDSGTFGVVEGSPADRWKGRPIAQLTRHDIRTLLAGIRAPYVANRTHAHLRSFLNWALRNDLIAASPFEGWRYDLAPEVQRERVLTPEEIGWLWQAATDTRSLLGLAVKLLLLTGQRREEVCRMTWSELSPDLSMWSLDKARTKNKRAHTVPLSGMAREVLQAVPRIAGPREYVFTRNGRTAMSAGTRFVRRLNALMERRAGHKVPEWRLHDIRRTVATGLQRLGVPQEVTEAVLNHKSGKITGVAAVYARHDYAQEKADALERWAHEVQRIVGGEAKVVPLRHKRQGA
jgi:integrase